LINWLLVILVDHSVEFVINSHLLYDVLEFELHISIHGVQIYILYEILYVLFFLIFNVLVKESLFQLLFKRSLYSFIAYFIRINQLQPELSSWVVLNHLNYIHWTLDLLRHNLFHLDLLKLGLVCGFPALFKLRRILLFFQMSSQEAVNLQKHALVAATIWTRA
jgi:hypothetical protein